MVATHVSAQQPVVPIGDAPTARALLPARSSSSKTTTTTYGFVPYRSYGDRAAPAPAALCHFTYYGGPVVSNVHVVPVMWGTNVNAQTTANMAQFYADAAVSRWYDSLSEYASVGGTLQSIGRGSSTAAITITPAICATSSHCNMTDAQLQAELLRQINVTQVLPAPELDAAGYANTIYMVHFPPNISLRDPNNSPSCAGGGFCAYHGTAIFGANTPMPYGAVMDTFTGGCSLGCGTDAIPFNNETANASHELAEAVTDTDVGLAVTVAAPLAWYSNDVNCGEVADPCTDGEGTITVSNRTWTVQQVWSEGQGACTSAGMPPNYAVDTPTTTPAGTAFSFNVTARNPYTNTIDSAYVGTVHFTSSDAAASLPVNFTFAPGDHGTAGFSATLMTLSTQTITATDTVDAVIFGTSATINVTPAADGTTLSTACPTKFVENQPIALSATVSGGLNPTGSITFADGPTVLCSGAPLVSGAASCQTAPLTVQGGGTSYVYNSIASYSGDASNSPSNSSVLPLTILAASDVVFRSGFETAVVGCPSH